MNKRPNTTSNLVEFMLVVIIFCKYLFCCTQNNHISIQINSYLVRDRFISVDSLEFKSTIIIGFRLNPINDNLSKLKVEGMLYHNNVLIDKAEIFNLDSSGNNLGFDVPVSQPEFSYNRPLGIPEGKYSVVINLLDDRDQLVTSYNKDLDRNQIGRLFRPHERMREKTQYGEAVEVGRGTVNAHHKQNLKSNNHADYLVFTKSYLRRVYPHTVPGTSEYFSTLFAEISQDEYKPITFSVRALQNLGTVKVSATPLKGVPGNLSPGFVAVGAVGQLTEVTRNEQDTRFVRYRLAPRIIEPKLPEIPQGHSQRFWLTLSADRNTPAGDYHGRVIIKPQFGEQKEIPVHIRALPLQLTDTNIQYGMMMTYAFYELDNDGWTERETALLKQRGREIYQDLREHGMTMIYPHSHFYFKRDSDGQVVLRSLRVSLETYNELAFPGPFCWYLGHLLQTAKPVHPGSIINYEGEVAKQRLRKLLKSYKEIATEVGISKEKLIVQLVDEPEGIERVLAGKELNWIALQMGFKTLVTRNWPDVDIICTFPPDDNNMPQKLRHSGRSWWIYPNHALTSSNRAYTRYVFGFGAWRWGVDGVVPWTYQMSQGCHGNPFTVLDGPEVMVTYPGVKGPIPTPTWEAIRDGINDYKYIYLLTQFIAAEKRKGNLKAISIDNRLQRFKHQLGVGPGKEENDFGDWPPESFERRRKQIVDWALELYKQRSGAGGGSQEVHGP
jgi:hypothetical protein